MRAIGHDVLNLKSPVLTSFAAFCVTATNQAPDCHRQRPGQRANRTKYKLASKTIATGAGIVTCGGR